MGELYKQHQCRELAIAIIHLISKMIAQKHFLELKLNQYSVSLKVDSGCDKPIINKDLWTKIGQRRQKKNGRRLFIKLFLYKYPKDN